MQNTDAHPLVGIWMKGGAAVRKGMHLHERIQRIPKKHAAVIHLVRPEARRVLIGIFEWKPGLKIIKNQKTALGKHAIHFVRDFEQILTIT